MGIRIELRDDETIEQAILRFRKMVREDGPPGAGWNRPKWHKRQLGYYLKPCELRRRDALRDEWATYSGECGRRHLLSVAPRLYRSRKAHFGNIQPVGDHGFNWRSPDWVHWFP
jgi:ribosomal protein S21